VKASAWINELVVESDQAVDVELPPFGQPILLY
jgi:hypothetical protein